jgi:TatD DNase family protein
VAIGEAGLDYFRVNSLDVRDNSLLIRKQKEMFLKQIELAVEIKKPLMIHCRPSKGTQDAYEEVIKIISNFPACAEASAGRQFPISKVRGCMHFFSGNLEIAKKFLDLGFILSFAGPITFSSDYDEVIKYAPLDMILSETDAPFASPAPFRGKTCYPQYVKEVVKKIAEIKNFPFEIVQKSLVENAVRVFSFVVDHG